MAPLDAFFQDSAPLNIWIAARSDGIAGSGTARDPLNGQTSRHPAVRISLTLTSHPSNREAEVVLLSGSGMFLEGDVVEISGVTGSQTEPWNGVFGIYNVTPT